MKMILSKILLSSTLCVEGLQIQSATVDSPTFQKVKGGKQPDKIPSETAVPLDDDRIEKIVNEIMLFFPEYYDIFGRREATFNYNDRSLNGQNVFEGEKYKKAVRVCLTNLLDDLNTTNPDFAQRIRDDKGPIARPLTDSIKGKWKHFNQAKLRQKMEKQQANRVQDKHEKKNQDDRESTDSDSEE